jgi:hypothetical protein
MEDSEEAITWPSCSTGEQPRRVVQPVQSTAPSTLDVLGDLFLALAEKDPGQSARVFVEFEYAACRWKGQKLGLASSA